MNRVLATIVIFFAAGGLAAAQSGPSGVIYNLANQHTYLVTPAPLSWQTARAYARSLGGHLVSINDASEQNFLATTYGPAQQPCWIGLSDAASEGVFVWDSGEPLGYADWCSGQPDDSGGAEDYVEIFSGGGSTPCWNDAQSPGTGLEATRGIVELPHGVRVNFDGIAANCAATPFPTPLSAPSGPGGVSWNGAGAAAGRLPLVVSAAQDGMPVSGSNYLRIAGEGVLGVPAGGPLPRPAPTSLNEVRIAIPGGTKGVSFAYDFVTTELPPINDGMAISIVDGSGNLITNLVYHDVLSSSFGATPPAGPACTAPGRHVLPIGPKSLARHLPVLPYPAYLSIVCWNGTDNFFPSFVAVDSIQFWGTGKLQLTMSAPFGPGSFRMETSQGTPNATFFTAATLVQGTFPNGWLFGIDIAPNDLVAEIMSGAPFSGVLDGSGGSVFTIPSGVPPGIRVYAVSIVSDSEVTASAPRLFLTE
jgi:hypothetical protein